jgi:hypothetical protein
MGLLDGDLAAEVAAALSAELLTGTLMRTSPATSAGLDEHGDPVDAVTRTWDVVGFREDYTAAYRASAGVPETDVKVSLLAGTLPAGVRPTKDDLVHLADAWHQVRAVRTDPATAVFECQSFEVRR